MFIERLKEVIFEKCNNSQKEFSVKTGIPESTVCHWLTRNIKPTYVQIIKICDVFQISADYLLGRESDNTGNVEIVGEVLTTDERKILDSYRRLNADGKTAFLSMTENLIKLNSLINKGL